MNNLNKNKTILFVVFVIMLLLSLFIYNSKNKTVEEEKVIVEDNVVILRDYNRFFTVNSSVYKYITFIQNKDVDSLLKVLNKEYISNNLITSDNLFNYVESLNGIYSFKAREIYYDELSETIIKYYVYGELIQETLNGYGVVSNRYYIVTFDIENQLFDITPFDDIGYKEVING